MSGAHGAANRLHVALFRRSLRRDQGLLIVTGSFEEVIVGRRRYEERHGIRAVDAPRAVELDRLMAAASLAALSLAERESWGWTMTAAGVPAGYFCAAEPEGMICGVVREAPAERASVYVQRKKGAGPLVESRYEAQDGDPVGVVADYFCKVAQIDTVLAVDEGWRCALAQAMPGGALARLEGLRGADLVEHCLDLEGREISTRLEEVVLFYECRCDEGTIRRMLASLDGEERARMWGDDARLRVECPRCGREFVVTRE